VAVNRRHINVVGKRVAVQDSVNVSAYHYEGFAQVNRTKPVP
jgi:hypothetical protein